MSYWEVSLEQQNLFCSLSHKSHHLSGIFFSCVLPLLQLSILIRLNTISWDKNHHNCRVRSSSCEYLRHGCCSGYCNDNNKESSCNEYYYESIDSSLRHIKNYYWHKKERNSKSCNQSSSNRPDENLVYDNSARITAWLSRNNLNVTLMSSSKSYFLWGKGSKYLLYGKQIEKI